MRCPICRLPVEDAQADRPGTAYPFCSERCKLIDLGRWLSGRYRIGLDDEGGEGPRPQRRPPGEAGGQ